MSFNVNHKGHNFIIHSDTYTLFKYKCSLCNLEAAYGKYTKYIWYTFNGVVENCHYFDNEILSCNDFIIKILLE